jgi:hypothetical protein
MKHRAEREPHRMAVLRRPIIDDRKSDNNNPDSAIQDKRQSGFGR